MAESPPRRRATARPPASLLVPGLLGAAFIVLPIAALVIRMPWRRLSSLLVDDVVLDALRVSLLTSIASAALAAVLGIPLAWLLARSELPGRNVLRAVTTLPMVLPPVVSGVALLLAFGRRGVIGDPLEAASGLVLPFSIGGVILANTFVALPFLVLTVEGALSGLDGRHETAAATLGASPFTVLRRVTLPMISPAVRAGLVLAWARALGEFGATITFAGSLQGRTQTLPLAVFAALESDRDAALAISGVLIIVSLAVLLSLRDQWWPAR